MSTTDAQVGQMVMALITAEYYDLEGEVSPDERHRHLAEILNELELPTEGLVPGTLFGLARTCAVLLRLAARHSGQSSAEMLQNVALSVQGKDH